MIKKRLVNNVKYKKPSPILLPPKNYIKIKLETKHLECIDHCQVANFPICLSVQLDGSWGTIVPMGGRREGKT